jgi:hypothetical protein
VGYYSDVIRQDMIVAFQYVPVDGQDAGSRVGTWTVGSNPATQTFDFNECTTKNVNDALSLGVMYIAAPGNYTWYFGYAADTDFGKFHLHLNDVDIAEIDCYRAAGHLANNSSSASLGYLAAGVYTICGKMLDKNAGSTNYGCRVNYVIIARDLV